MSKKPPGNLAVPPSPAHYPHPTEAAFSRAVELLGKTLPEHQAALRALLETGQIHDAAAVIAVLEGGAS